MPRPNPYKQIQLLRRWQAEAREDLESRVKRTARKMRHAVQDAVAEEKNLNAHKTRTGLYSRITDLWDDLARDIDSWAFDITYKVSKKFREEARDAAIAQADRRAVKTGITKFSRKHAEDIYELIHPGNKQHLAGVFTNKMANTHLQALRNSVVAVNRQAAIEGWTHARIHKELQNAWGELANDFGVEKFVDVAGRRWSNARYLDMLIRTTTARVARESYNQQLAEMGDDLIRARSVGDSCPVCKAWDGVIMSISGADKRFPSYQQAINAGYLHPSCDCLTERVDETLHAKDRDQQAGVKNVDWNDHYSVAKYRDEGKNGASVPKNSPSSIGRKVSVPDSRIGAGRKALDWIDTNVNKKLFPIGAVKIVGSTHSRGYYHPGTREAHVRDDAANIVHEIGHAMEFDHPDVYEKCVAFRKKRTKGEAAQRLRDLTGITGYRANEIAYEDSWVKLGGSHYCGRKYPDGLKATEILTMGLERLYNDAEGFAKQDPEYYNFIRNLIK